MLLQMTLLHYFSWLSSISARVQARVWGGVGIRHILFIHSSVGRHLGCFHVLSLVNSGAVTIGVRVIFFELEEANPPLGSSPLQGMGGGPEGRV